MAESAPVGLFATDVSGRARFVNRNGAEICGCDPERLVDEPWWTRFRPEDRERVAAEWERASGRGEPFSIDGRVVRPGGDSRIVQATCVPTRAGDGSVTGYVGSLVDLTEERAQAAHLAAASRLAALGTLVAGVAHEINNPLAAQLASEGFALDDLRALRAELAAAGRAIPAGALARIDAVLEALGDSIGASKRIARIVHDLTVFGRADRPRSRVALHREVQGALDWLWTSVPSAASIRLETSEVEEVLAVAGQIRQVVVNLVTNAAKAIPDGRRGTVTVRVGPGRPGTACIEVTDDGVGMAPEVVARIFDPFFTTRKPGEGMGLGLPVCHAIVAAHGGTLEVESVPGQGSTFRVELPLAD